MEIKETFSIRAYFTDGRSTTHYVELELKQLKKWIEAYKFTHPNCTSITIKIWFK